MTRLIWDDNAKRGPNVPTNHIDVVLVHGVWADGSSWNGVSTELQDQGFTVLTPPNLLRGVTTDAPYVASFLAQRTNGPVVLVGHSYGGFVITNAALAGGDVKALVYVDAFMPDGRDDLRGPGRLGVGAGRTRPDHRPGRRRISWGARGRRRRLP